MTDDNDGAYPGWRPIFTAEERAEILAGMMDSERDQLVASMAEDERRVFMSGSRYPDWQADILARRRRGAQASAAEEQRAAKERQAALERQPPAVAAQELADRFAKRAAETAAAALREVAEINQRYREEPSVPLLDDVAARWRPSSTSASRPISTHSIPTKVPPPSG